MFRYWTFWNFSWYLGSELNLFNYSGPLMTSIINTSLIGAYMTYVYPKRVVIKIKNKKYELPYYQVILLDFVFHQIPLIRFFQTKSNKNICGMYVILPVCGWFCINSYRDLDHNRIYNIDIIKLFSVSCLITASYGLFKHIPKIKN